MSSNYHCKYECECQEVRKKFIFVVSRFEIGSYLIQEVYSPETSVKPIGLVEIELLALALGPKRCDLEVRSIRTQAPIGRIQLEIDVKQYQTLGVTLQELQCHMTGQEERAIYSQFKVISNNDVPRISEQTKTLIGRFKKDKNTTKFKWNYTGNEEEESNPAPEVNYDIAMETLKNSSIQMLFKVDRYFSVQQTELVLQKIKLEASRSLRDKEHDARRKQSSGGHTQSSVGGEIRTNGPVRDDISVSINRNETESSGRPEEGLEFELKHGQRDENHSTKIILFPQSKHAKTNDTKSDEEKAHGRSHSVN